MSSNQILRRSVINQISTNYTDWKLGTGSITSQVIAPCGKIAYTTFLNENRRIDGLDHQYKVYPQSCYGTTFSFDEAVEVVRKEREYQEQKWGKDRPQSLAGFLLILQKEVNEAVDGWMKNSDGRDSPLNEVVQVAATALACIERYGETGNTINVNDIAVLPQQPEHVHVELKEGPTVYFKSKE